MKELSGWEKGGFYFASVLLTVGFLIAGGMKVSGQEPMIQSFTHFGLPLWLMYFIGTAELLGAIALWIPRLAALSGIGLSIIMAGAVIMHAIHDPITQAIPAVVFGLLLVIVTRVRLPQLRNQHPTHSAV